MTGILGYTLAVIGIFLYSKAKKRRDWDTTHWNIEKGKGKGKKKKETENRVNKLPFTLPVWQVLGQSWIRCAPFFFFFSIEQHIVWAGEEHKFYRNRQYTWCSDILTFSYYYTIQYRESGITLFHFTVPFGKQVMNVLWYFLVHVILWITLPSYDSFQLCVTSISICAHCNKYGFFY